MKPSKFTYLPLVREYGYCNNIEFRRDGYTITSFEVSDDFTVALINDELVEFDDEFDPIPLLRHMMANYGMPRDEASLMMPNLETVVAYDATTNSWV